MLNNYIHTPVMLNEAVHYMNIEPDSIYLDCTFGRGGHSLMILSKLHEQGRLFAIDRDPAAIEAAQKIKDPRFMIIHGPFSAIADYMKKFNLLGQVKGILLDLGVSSPQIDDPQRGFSFMHDGPLDMRMDTTCGQSAAQWLLQAREEEIALVLKTFGEERLAKRIAKAIIQQKKKKQITSTRELAELISNVIPCNYKHKHPATRTFQAIRIYINSELEEIERALNGALTVLAPGGRLSVISFHSLEDRLVKSFIRQHSGRPLVPDRFALTEEQIAQLYKYNMKLKLVGKIQPSAKEINHNPRARSSLLRCAEKLDHNE